MVYVFVISETLLGDRKTRNILICEGKNNVRQLRRFGYVDQYFIVFSNLTRDAY